mmetsp:Transcript_24027/g.52067  ORF Transcript_24027/g.52067 Transcript_24027/m.52067 type:complete len:136 (+) Transcript_24027:244-651(+)|eukprot:CAMPEP_0175905280 /NCGR_PEP_ID=MMETSP0108-20121206/4927_1 /TAXON_ID=195067 ORGANISM="Goniomonas pacifica, Strain CCMP1869" /NCGR_SAMPLE_ID=MMETSP0108 /ASSEMBLY_ACC=CAM_ASM_000204 /LENGTH=135 /DNA_ID=CAMNT_0017227151 /DNA_START=313 /DNA_END=720 /DNA_ORIENTATION=-
MSRGSLERLALRLILQRVLRRYFLHSAYATNVYVTHGAARDSLLRGGLTVSMWVRSSGADTADKKGKAATKKQTTQTSKTQTFKRLKSVATDAGATRREEEGEEEGGESDSDFQPVRRKRRTGGSRQCVIQVDSD